MERLTQHLCGKGAVVKREWLTNAVQQLGSEVRKGIPAAAVLAKLNSRFPSGCLLRSRPRRSSSIGLTRILRNPHWDLAFRHTTSPRGARVPFPKT